VTGLTVTLIDAEPAPIRPFVNERSLCEPQFTNAFAVTDRLVRCGAMTSPRWEGAVESSIREAMARGEFDRLSGAGEPIPGLDEPHDELWWVKDKLRREDVATVPPSLAVRRDRDQLIANLASFRTEAALRAAIDDLNQRIRTINRYGSPSGPPTSLMPQDAETIVARWNELRH
jgi:Domain of unknown function (DUF1992)